MSNFRKISKRSRIHVLFSFLLSLSDFYQCRKIGIACPMDCSKPAPPRSSRISKVSVIVGQLVRRSAGLRLRARLASPRLALTRENGASSPLVDARLQGRQAPRSHYSPSCFPPWFRGGCLCRANASRVPPARTPSITERRSVIARVRLNHPTLYFD